MDQNLYIKLFSFEEEIPVTGYFAVHQGANNWPITTLNSDPTVFIPAPSKGCICSCYFGKNCCFIPNAMIFFGCEHFFSNNCTFVRNVYTFMFQKLRFYPAKPNGVFCRKKKIFAQQDIPFTFCQGWQTAFFLQKATFSRKRLKFRCFRQQ